MPLGPIVAVTGLHFERRVIARWGGRVISGGGNCEWLENELDAAVQAGARGLISIGIAGGLAPFLANGQIVIGAGVVAGAERFGANSAWSDHLSCLFPDAVVGDIAAGPAAVASATEKAHRYRQDGAIAADMESHAVARVAARAEVPFALLRVIADTAQDDLPLAALVGVGDRGTIAIGAVISSLLRAPAQLPALVRSGWRTRRALRVLMRRGHLLGASFGFPNFGESALDVR